MREAIAMHEAEDASAQPYECFLECASVARTSGPLRWDQPAVIDGHFMWTGWEENFIELVRRHAGHLRLSEIQTLYGLPLQAPAKVLLKEDPKSSGGVDSVLTWTVSQYLDAAIAGRTDKYLSNLSVDEFPEIAKRYQPDKLPATNLFKRSVEMTARELFIGGENTQYSRLHIDAAAASVWCLCLAGAKEWIIFPPGDSDALFAHRRRDRQIRFSVLDPWDRHTCELFDKKLLHPMRVVVGPGELLFLPPNWFHITRNHGLTATINQRSWSWQAMPMYARFLWHVHIGSRLPGPPRPYKI